MATDTWRLDGRCERLVENLETLSRAELRASESRVIELRLSQALPMLVDLRCSREGLLVRQLYDALGFDRNLLHKTRLEHKLVQALALQHYAPGSVPRTEALAVLLPKPREAIDLHGRLKDHFGTSEYIVKPALGYGSGDRGFALTRSDEILAAFARGLIRLDGPIRELWNEPFVVQEKWNIAGEFRIHSFQALVVEDLTFDRYQPDIIPSDRKALNQFVQNILSRLPSAMTENFLIAWDVGCSSDGRMAVLEMNYTGFHSVYEKGFQCSGTFLFPKWGPLMCARLLRHVQARCDMRIGILADVPADTGLSEFYAWTRRWLALLEVSSASRHLSLVHEETKGAIAAESLPLQGLEETFHALRGEFARASERLESQVLLPNRDREQSMRLENAQLRRLASILNTETERLKSIIIQNGLSC